MSSLSSCKAPRTLFAAGSPHAIVETVCSTEALAMARSLISLIGFRDHYTTSHSGRVENYVREIAAELGLSAQETDTAVSAAAVHDIGKIAIPDNILLKPGRLTDDELAWIQKYPEWGW